MILHFKTNSKGLRKVYEVRTHNSNDGSLITRSIVGLRSDDAQIVERDGNPKVNRAKVIIVSPGIYSSLSVFCAVAEIPEPGTWDPVLI